MGPLLFLIYMGVIGERVGDSFLFSFVDDISISRPVTTVEEVLHLQEDLNTVYAWAAASNMQFNEEMLRHSPNQNTKEETKLHT